MRRWQEGADESARFLNYFPADRDLLLTQAAAQFALSGDRAAYAAAVESLPRAPADPTGAGAAVEAAEIRGDYAAADRILTNPNLTLFTEPGSSVINDPVAMLRAKMAIYRGDTVAGRRFAVEALRFYRESSWNPRQQVWVRMRIALAEAWSGQSAEALRDGPAAMTDALAQDHFDAANLRKILAEIYLSLDRRAEALATLREMMSDPGAVSPNHIRINPLWSRLKDDPRFEEILRSAKPL
jgi:hypothetical protein